ncbi:TcpE family conjugal transfer membrane protein [Pseudolactococcus yaeyamensis]
MAENTNDKYLYAYKRALEEQNTFHTIFGYPLLSPIKYSFVGYAFLILLVEALIWYRLLKFIPTGWAFAVALLVAYRLGQKLADKKIDGKHFPIFIRDWLVFYFVYGRKRKKCFLNKGILYEYEREKRGNEFKNEF